MPLGPYRRCGPGVHVTPAASGQTAQSAAQSAPACSFAPVAEGAGYSRYDFAIFCGVTTMLLSLALAICYLLGINKV